MDTEYCTVHVSGVYYTSKLCTNTEGSEFSTYYCTAAACIGKSEELFKTSGKLITTRSYNHISLILYLIIIQTQLSEPSSTSSR